MDEQEFNAWVAHVWPATRPMRNESLSLLLDDRIAVEHCRDIGTYRTAIIKAISATIKESDNGN